MSLYEKIISIYPELTPKDFLTAIRLQNDLNGFGDYISLWEHPTLPRPTDLQLQDIELSEINAN
jgi:hypothetical protein